MSTAAYKHADGKKIDGRRVLVDVERSRTVKGWLPRRLGGGIGGTRRGGPDVNVKHSGREELIPTARRSRSRSPVVREPKEVREPRESRDSRKPRERRRRSRSRSREDGRERHRERKRRSRDRSRSRDRDRDLDERGDDVDALEMDDRKEESFREKRRSRSRERERKRRRSRSRSRDRSERKRRDRGDRRDREKDYLDKLPPGVTIKQEPVDNDYSNGMQRGVDGGYHDNSNSEGFGYDYGDSNDQSANQYNSYYSSSKIAIKAEPPD